MQYKQFAMLYLMFFLMTVRLGAGVDMSQADSLFAKRNAKFDSIKILVDSANIDKSIQMYHKIIEKSTDTTEKYEAIWKILRAYFFKGMFVTTDAAQRRAIFLTGIRLGESHLSKFPDSVEIHCWLGILWGYWGELASTLAAARAGVPNKVKFLAKKTIELDKFYLDAGGYRMLGRLHFKVPRIPLFLSWPSKTKSIEYLEKAHRLAPDNLFNKLYLAEVLLDQQQEARARRLLKEIIHTKTLCHGIAADTFIKQQARLLLK